MRPTQGDRPLGRGDGPPGQGDGPIGRSDGPLGQGDGPIGRGDRPTEGGDRPPGGRLTSRGDVVLVCAAIACFAGAHLSLALPTTLVAATVALSVAVGMAMRAPVALVAAVFVVSSVLGVRAWDGVEPVAPAPFAEAVMLVSDPVSYGPTVRAQVRSDVGHLDAWFQGGAAGTVKGLLAGERLEVSGTLSPRSDDTPWLAVRHVVGRLQVQHAEVIGEPPVPWRLANRLRRSLDRGARSLGPAQHGVLVGVVVGDDRLQSPEVVDDFRAAGLSHLTAVSGTHVAHVLVAAGPLLRRLGPRSRLAATLVLLAGFALVTRFQPSVLRATTMAALATTGMVMGRRGPAARNLAGAVCVLVTMDPLLARSVGFAMSVAASAGILAFGRPIETALPGPRLLVAPLAVTVAAQAGVAPLLLGVFGGIPVASLPANVAASHAVGPLTIWGLTVGTAVGALPDAVAAVAHVPTRLLTGWLLGVARWSTELHLGELGWREWAVGGAAAAVVVGRRQPRDQPRPGEPGGPGEQATTQAATHAAIQAGEGHDHATATGPPGALGVLGTAALGVLLVALVVPAVEVRRPPPAHGIPTPGVTVWHHDATVVVVGPEARPGFALEAVRRAGVRRADVLVLTTTAHAPRTTAEALVSRLAPPVVWVPDGVRFGRHPTAGEGLVAGGLRVTVAPDGTGIDVHVEPVGADGQRTPGPVLGSPRAPPPGTDAP